MWNPNPYIVDIIPHMMIIHNSYFHPLLSCCSCSSSNSFLYILFLSFSSFSSFTCSFFGFLMIVGNFRVLFLRSLSSYDSDILPKCFNSKLLYFKVSNFGGSVSNLFCGICIRFYERSLNYPDREDFLLFSKNQMGDK